jgi:DNA-binding TFAR19-related protein (PDSD5 family)
MASSGMLRRVALVRTDVSEELSASFIRVTRMGEVGTTLTVTSNRRTLRKNAKYQGISSQLASVASYS